MRKHQKRTVGDVVRIDLGDGFHTYARVLEKALFAFYDDHVRKALPIERIITLPILFQIPVMRHAITNMRWVIVGNTTLDKSLLNPPLFLMQDILRKGRVRIYEQGGTIRPATKRECIGLERAAVWEPNHVEDRLCDHYAGRKNKWVESLKIKESDGRIRNEVKHSSNSTVEAFAYDNLAHKLPSPLRGEPRRRILFHGFRVGPRCGRAAPPVATTRGPFGANARRLGAFGGEVFGWGLSGKNGRAHAGGMGQGMGAENERKMRGAGKGSLAAALE